MTHQRFRVAILILALAATCVGVSEAITLGCGDTIGPASGTFTLEADVTCEKATVLPAITIVGPARLDMNGHAVACKFDPDAFDSPNGIMLHGPAALVMNGTVRGCSFGIRVQGDRNRVAGMTIASGNAGGIDVFGDQNAITGSSVRANEGPVVVVVGDRNLGHRNVVDLVDRNGDCVANSWRKNVFETAAPACIE